MRDAAQPKGGTELMGVRQTLPCSQTEGEGGLYEDRGLANWLCRRVHLLALLVLGSDPLGRSTFEGLDHSTLPVATNGQ
jgi:hypothetical protein